MLINVPVLPVMFRTVISNYGCSLLRAVFVHPSIMLVIEN